MSKMKTPAELDIILWNLLGTGERYANGAKKFDRIYRRLMQFQKTGTRPKDAFNNQH